MLSVFARMCALFQYHQGSHLPWFIALVINCTYTCIEIQKTQPVVYLYCMDGHCNVYVCKNHFVIIDWLNRKWWFCVILYSVLLQMIKTLKCVHWHIIMKSPFLLITGAIAVGSHSVSIIFWVQWLLPEDSSISLLIFKISHILFELWKRTSWVWMVRIQAKSGSSWWRRDIIVLGLYLDCG